MTAGNIEKLGTFRDKEPSCQCRGKGTDVKQPLNYNIRINTLETDYDVVSEPFDQSIPNIYNALSFHHGKAHFYTKDIAYFGVGSTSMHYTEITVNYPARSIPLG